jgi:hypothetical protein
MTVTDYRPPDQPPLSLRRCLPSLPVRVPGDSFESPDFFLALPSLTNGAGPARSMSQARSKFVQCATSRPASPEHSDPSVGQRDGQTVTAALAAAELAIHSR